MGFELSELVKLLKPKSINVDRNLTVGGVSIDSRTIQKGEVFVALEGERFDGHEFAAEAVRKSGTFAVVSRPVNCPYLLVEDTLEALKLLAGYNLEKSNATSIAVVGSVGKTTTKELLAGFLSCNNCVCKSFENENNVIGVCKTLLRLKNEQFCVVEVGVNKPHEMEEIASFFRPDGVLFLNVKNVHLEFFESVEQVFLEKSKIVHSGATLVFNGDDDILFEAYKNRPKSFCFTCRNRACDFYAYDESFISVYGLGTCIRTKKRDEINPLALVASVSCGMVFDSKLNEECVNNVVDAFEPVGFRMKKVKLGAVDVILDCYNANVDSMKYAIDVLSCKKGKKLAVLGDMFELGKYAESAHREVGRYLKGKGIDLVAIGEFSQFTFDEVNGFASAWHFKEKREATAFLRNAIKNYDVVLFKASRGMKLEEIYYALKGN